MFLSLTVVFNGCGETLILHPITNTDIYFKDNGDICFSEYYFNSVLKLKIDESQ